MRPVLLLVIVAVLLTACAERKPPVVIERTLSGAATHTVVAGDTLYSIALRYDRDYRELALINGLGADYLIKPGQRLRLDGKPAVVVASKPVEPPVKPAETVSKPAAKTAATEKSAPVTPAKPVAKAPATQTSKPAATPTPTKTTATPVTATTSTSASSSAQSPASNRSVSPSASVSTSGWIWPAKGSVISRFGAQGLSGKGLDIAGQQGDAVIAAANGTVVYAGSGLVGYGKLLILRHDDNYISAYAHNDRFLVAEGEVVKAGQQIADMGASGTDRHKLHFEIREKGKPVDPLRFLPAR